MSQGRVREWMLPRFICYRVAGPGLRLSWNRYGNGGVIGAALVLGSYCFGVRWFRLLPAPVRRRS